MITLTKYGHACLLLDKAGSKLMIDPGRYTKLPADLSDIGCVVITEEHGDHFDSNSLKAILQQSPNAKIFTTKVVSAKLAEEQIASIAVQGEQTFEAAGYTLHFYETDHAPVYQNSPCRSLATKVDDYLYYPSDSFYVIADQVEVLALPTSGPWGKAAETIDFANTVKSRTIIATHNGFYNDAGNAMAENTITSYLADPNRQFVSLQDGQTLT